MGNRSHRFRSIRLAARLAALGLAVALPVGAWGQEPQYLLPPAEPESLRALSLGGAFVGLADDAGTITVNPGGLAVVPRSFDFLAGIAGTSSGARPRYAAVAFHPRPWLAGGVSWSQRESSDPLAPPLARRGLPEAVTVLSGPAVGFGTLLPDPRFSFGATAVLQRLTADPGGQERRSDWDTSFATGLVFRPSNPEAPQLALRYTHRADWRFPDAARVRSPSVISAGVSWYYGILRISRLTFSLQPDWVLYSQVTEGAVAAAAARNEIDLRLGLEASFPFDCYTGCGSMFQVRFGVHNMAPQPFALGVDGDPGSEVGQGPSRRTRWTAGAALALRQVMTGRIKIEASYDNRDDRFAFGIGLRFPEAYRADIEAQTRR